MTLADYLEKMSDSLREKANEVRRKENPGKVGTIIKVIQEDSVIYYPSMRATARHIGVSEATIRRLFKESETSIVQYKQYKLEQVKSLDKNQTQALP